MVEREPRIYEFVDDTAEVFVPSESGDDWERVAGPDASEFTTDGGARWLYDGRQWVKQ